jgi:hypothetical protein
LHEASERNMAEWFHERYISRAEHQQIVDYYKKLVVQLHRKVKELRVLVDSRPLEVAEIGAHEADGATRLSSKIPPRDYGGNVISLEDRRDRRGRAD